MEKRMVLALILSLGILLGFQFIYKQPAPAPSNIQEASVDQGTVTNTIETETPFGSSISEKTSSTAPEQETTISTNKFEITFSDIGGAIKKWRMKEFEKGTGQEILIDGEQPLNRPFAIQSSAFAGVAAKKHRGMQSNGTVEYTIEMPDQYELSKKYTYGPDQEYILLELNIKNLSKEPKELSYVLTGPASVKESGAVQGRSFLTAVADIGEKLVKKNSAKGTWEQKGELEWVAIKNRYFAVILKPYDNPLSVYIQGEKQQELATFVGSRKRTIPPGGVFETKYALYASPLDEKKLAAIGYGMEQLVDYGWFGGISKLLLNVLRFFHKWVHNWGVAIILLTVMINIITFPLTKKSFVSMQQMKKVQPHMQKLKELHKDNPQKLNKEMMELYKKYNVNPFGGCLPMLLQIPIFVALYQGLMASVELKGAQFLWVKDLAAPDAAPIPWDLPFIGNHINILPLLMIIMMFVQQKLSQGASMGMSAEQEKQQQLIMVLMPVFFGFLFYTMPSGLVLYWLVNTILMCGEQALMLKND